jgi:predicted O-methyltransferase YrrM
MNLLVKKFKVPYDQVPMHIDMSCYAPFYEAAVAKVLETFPDKRKTIMELGTRHGCSARIILEALPEDENWKVILIDPVMSDYVQELVDDVRVDFWKGVGQDFARKVKFQSVALLHIDVDPHTYEYTKEVFRAFEDKIKVGGIVLFHDASNYAGFGVRKFVEELGKSPEWEITLCPEHPSSPISAPAMAVRLHT